MSGKRGRKPKGEFQDMGDAQPNAMRPWHGETITPRHKQVLLAHAAGLKNTEICEVLGLSQSRVSTFIRDPRAPRFIEEFLKDSLDQMRDVNARLKAYANEALDIVIDQIRDDTQEPTLRQRGAFSLLDRAGHGKIEKKLIATAEVDPKAAEILGAALEAAKHVGRVIDADYTEVVSVDS